jgi:L-histidine N-alpha-methyltransferase
MRSLVNVAIHPSQFPENLRRDLLTSLRARQLNHKFLYDGIKQTQKWLALHEACSPARNDIDCVETYDKAFGAAAERVAARRVHVISLGCGGGQKDVSLLRLLRQSGKRVSYTPCDVSVAMVLTARQSALEILDSNDCFPLVCDLLTADDLAGVLRQQTPVDVARLVTFFGLIPNFEPHVILPRLADVLHPNDCLLFSANLAPGSDYAAGVQRIRSLYDNALTRDWLMTFLLDLGVEQADGELVFAVQDCPGGTGLKRIEANFHFQRSRKVQVLSDEVEFQAGEHLRLFFSYRHTPDQVRALLKQYGLDALDVWISRSEEEGVFLCAQRKQGR